MGQNNLYIFPSSLYHTGKLNQPLQDELQSLCAVICRCVGPCHPCSDLVPFAATKTFHSCQNHLSKSKSAAPDPDLNSRRWLSCLCLLSCPLSSQTSPFPLCILAQTDVSGCLIQSKITPGPLEAKPSRLAESFNTEFLRCLGPTRDTASFLHGEMLRRAGLAPVMSNKAVQSFWSKLWEAALNDTWEVTKIAAG